MAMSHPSTKSLKNIFLVIVGIFLYNVISFFFMPNIEDSGETTHKIKPVKDLNFVVGGEYSEEYVLKLASSLNADISESTDYDMYIYPIKKTEIEQHIYPSEYDFKVERKIYLFHLKGKLLATHFEYHAVDTNSGKGMCSYFRKKQKDKLLTEQKELSGRKKEEYQTKAYSLSYIYDSVEEPIRSNFYNYLYSSEINEKKCSLYYFVEFTQKRFEQKILN